jgi:thiosulfate dehydrogenase [quinone] large subunit
MQATFGRFFRSPAILSAFIGFLVIFSACTAGYDYYQAGKEKAGESVWIGDKAGTAITGFIKGADAKAVKSAQNPNPEVLPVARDLNTYFINHTKLFSYMVVLGEILMPIGVLFFLVVKFPASRFFLMGIAGLAAFMNFLYLSEGTSSTNPPMAFMWLAIIWLAALVPSAALYYAIDVRKLFGKQVAEAPATIETTPGQWLIFATVFVVVLAAGWAMYSYTTYAAIILASILLTAVLSAINAALARRGYGTQVATNVRHGTTPA